MTDDFTSRLQAALGSAYAIERELGGGGMSRVYLARDTALHREVVLKVLPPELTSSVNLERFRREIQYAAQLQHPHIVPLLSAGESGDLIWYTMPRIPGESLRSVLERRGAMPGDEVVQILRDVADALGTAHQAGLVHRDIKPENILIQGEHALVTDFGVAKAISASLPGSGATAVGVAIGTPAYMAPEQVAGDPAADHRIDLYALGLLAYELLTGQTPFRGDSPHQTMAAHLIRQPTPPDTVRAGLPRGLSPLVMRCLQKDPADRYPDAAALIQDLRRISEGSGDRIAMPALAGSAGPGRPRTGRMAVGLALVGAAMAAGYLLAVALAPAEGAAPAPDSIVAAPAESLPPAPAELSPVDSLAIEEAVERRLAQQAAAAASVTRAMLDSIRREITLAVTDSVRNAQPPAGTRPAQGGDRQVDAELAESFGRNGLRGQPPGAPDRPGDPSALLMLPTDARQLAEVLGPGQQRWADQLREVLDQAPNLRVVRRSGRADSLLRSGVSAEAVARAADARFYMTMVPVRRRDSVSFTIIVHDLQAPTRPARTVRTAFLPIGAAEPLRDSIATQVARTVAGMQRGPERPRPPG